LDFKKINFLIFKVNATERTCVVRWKDKPAMVEQMSMYSISSLSDYEYRLGDIVLRIDQPSATASSPSRTSLDAPLAGLTQSASDNNTSLPWIGEVVDVYDGLITVHWSDSTRTVVLPEQIFALDRYVAWMDEWQWLTLCNSDDDDDDEEAEAEEEKEEATSEAEGEESSARPNESSQGATRQTLNPVSSTPGSESDNGESTSSEDERNSSATVR